MLACEIEAEAESVKLLTLGWNVPRDEAIEQVHRVQLLSYLSWKRTGKGRSHGHGPEAEFAAFRYAFDCTDLTGKTCANGPLDFLTGPSTAPSPTPKAEN